MREHPPPRVFPVSAPDVHGSTGDSEAGPTCRGAEERDVVEILRACGGLFVRDQQGELDQVYGRSIVSDECFPKVPRLLEAHAADVVQEVDAVGFLFGRGGSKVHLVEKDTGIPMGLP